MENFLRRGGSFFLLLWVCALVATVGGQTVGPTEHPTRQPTSQSTSEPSSLPSILPMSQPTESPSSQPTARSTAQPFIVPSGHPSVFPSAQPSAQPTQQPSVIPSGQPSVFPSAQPSLQPSVIPSGQPSVFPSAQPSAQPTQQPSVIPSGQPTSQPSAAAGKQYSHPKLLSATFQQDGSILALSFDVDTNLGGLSDITFGCHRLFSFACANASTCSWVSRRIAVATLSAYASQSRTCLTVSGRVSVASSARITVECMTSACQQLAKSDQLPIAQASRFVAARIDVNTTSTPIVVISAPTTVGSCTNLVLDVTSSIGNGGRPWQNVSATVSSDNSSHSAIVSMVLQSQFLVSGALTATVPSNLIQQETWFTFTVRMCNFLHRCSSSEKTVIVKQVMLPVVNIAGSASRTLTRGQSLSLTAVAALPNCVANQSIWLVYKWSVLVNGQNSTLTSIASNPAVFQLSAFALSAQKNYTITVTVAPSNDKKQLVTRSFTSVQVRTITGSLIPVIKNGVAYSIYAGSALVIDATNSYDEDTVNLNVASGISYALSCTNTSRSTCASLFRISSSTTGIFTVTSLSSSSATVTANAMFHLILSKSNHLSSTTAIAMTVLPNNKANIAFTTTRAIINPADSLRITAAVSLPSGYVGNATWKAAIKSTGLVLDLSDRSLTPVLSLLSAVSSAKSTKLYLALPANVLESGCQYVFTLRCDTVNPIHYQSTSASVTIAVNAKPTSGSFTVSPLLGKELTTSFAFACKLWIDTDLPLTFAFGYLSIALNQEMLLRSVSEETSFTSVLVAGNQRQNDSLVTYATVFDALQAFSTVHQAIGVKALSTATATAVLDTLFNVTSSTNLNTIRQSIAFASTLSNQVNCSSALNCSALHRQACSRVAHTCGPCESPLWIGDYGDANTACISIAQAKSNTNSVSVSANALKTCPLDCSQHGDCQYLSLVSGAPLIDCAVGQWDCYGQCNCHDGFYGDTCSLTSADWALHQKSRATTTHSLLRATSLDDESTAALNVQIASLLEISRQPSELSQSTVDSLSTLMVSALTSQSTVATTFLSSSVSSFVDSLVESVLLGMELQDGNITTAMRETQSLVSDVIHRQTSAIWRSMSPSQSAVDIVQNNFRMTVFSLSSNESSTTAGVSLPVTAFESVLSMTTPSVHLPSATNVKGFASVHRLPPSFVDVVSSLNAMKENQFDLIVLSASNDSLPCLANGTGLSDCHSSVTFPRYSQLAHASVSVNRSIPFHQMIRCSPVPNRFVEVTCPDNLKYKFMCNGSDSVFRISCPVTSFVPICRSAWQESSITNQFTTFEDCSTLSVSSDEVSCSCPLVPSTGQRTRRALSSAANNNDDAVQVAFVAVLQRRVTILSARKLKSSTNNGMDLLGLGTLGGLVLFGLLLLMASVMCDNLDFGLYNTPLFELENDQPQNVELWTKYLNSAVGFGLQRMSLYARMKRAVVYHHRWTNLIKLYSSRVSRSLRFLAPCGHAVSAIFFMALTYDLSPQDAGRCRLIGDQPNCVAKASSFATGDSECYWDSIDHTCRYNQPANNILMMYFVAVFAIVLSSILEPINNRIVFHLAAAPLAYRLNHVALGVLGNAQRSAVSPEQEFARDWDLFEVTLKACYHKLRSPQKEEFADLWSLNTQGEVQSTNPAVLLQMKKDMRTSIATSFTELASLRHYRCNDREQSMRVLYHFQRDMIGGNLETMISNEDKRCNVIIAPQPYWIRRAALLFVSAQYIGMLIYCLLFCMHSTHSLLKAWAQSLCIWLILELLFVSPVCALVVNFAIPLSFVNELTHMKVKVAEMIAVLASYRTEYITSPQFQAQRDSYVPSYNPIFNTAKHFFVSSRMAKVLHSLPVSQIVLEYSTIWPRQSYAIPSLAKSTPVRGMSLSWNRIQDFCFQLFMRFIGLSRIGQEFVVQFVSASFFCLFFYVSIVLFETQSSLVTVPIVLVTAGLLILAIVIVLRARRQAKTPFAIEQIVESSSEALLHNLGISSDPVARAAQKKAYAEALQQDQQEQLQQQQSSGATATNMVAAVNPPHIRRANLVPTMFPSHLREALQAQVMPKPASTSKDTHQESSSDSDDDETGTRHSSKNSDSLSKVNSPDRHSDSSDFLNSISWSLDDDDSGHKQLLAGHHAIKASKLDVNFDNSEGKIMDVTVSHSEMDVNLSDDNNDDEFSLDSDSNDLSCSFSEVTHSSPSLSPSPSPILNTKTIAAKAHSPYQQQTKYKRVSVRLASAVTDDDVAFELSDESEPET